MPTKGNHEFIGGGAAPLGPTLATALSNNNVIYKLKQN